jgi:hypothetical protein
VTHRSWGKPDSVQPAIVDALFKAGCRVQVLSAVGMGCPDLLVSKAGAMWLLELKLAGEPLTPAQKKWHATWDAPVYVVHTAEEALEVVMR